MTDLDAGDGPAVICPGCQHPFTPVGRQTCCCEACRVAVYRRGREAAPVPVVAPKRRLRQPIAVYVCDRCGARAVGNQRCEGCQTAMRRLGLGGCCPACKEPVAVDELLGQEVNA